MELEMKINEREELEYVMYAEGEFVVPENIRIIGSGCFYYDVAYYTNKITSIRFPNSVKVIKEQAFASCESLQSLNLPEKLEYIGGHAFSYCSSIKGKVVIPNSVTHIGEGAFECCRNITSFVIPSTLVDIQGGAFCSCESIKEPIIHNGVLLYLPNNYKGEYIVPDSVTIIRKQAITYCDELTSLVIPDTVVEIDSWAVSCCDNLKNIRLPKSFSWSNKIQFFLENGCTFTYEGITYTQKEFVEKFKKEYIIDKSTITIPLKNYKFSFYTSYGDHAGCKDYNATVKLSTNQVKLFKKAIKEYKEGNDTTIGILQYLEGHLDSSLYDDIHYAIIKSIELGYAEDAIYECGIEAFGGYLDPKKLSKIEKMSIKKQAALLAEMEPIEFNDNDIINIDI